MIASSARHGRAHHGGPAVHRPCASCRWRAATIRSRSAVRPCRRSCCASTRRSCCATARAASSRQTLNVLEGGLRWTVTDVAAKLRDHPRGHGLGRPARARGRSALRRHPGALEVREFDVRDRAVRAAPRDQPAGPVAQALWSLFGARVRCAAYASARRARNVAANGCANGETTRLSGLFRLAAVPVVLP